MAHWGIARLLLLTLLLAGCATPAPTISGTAIPAVSTALAVSETEGVTGSATSNVTSEIACPNARGPIDAPIIFGAGNNLNMMQPDGSGLNPVFDLPATAWAHEPAWSPDGATLAFMFSLPALASDIPGLQISLICGVDRATGTGRILLQGSADTEALEEPAWTSDGRAMIVTRRQTSADPETGYIGSKLAIVRYKLADGSAKVLVEGAAYPALSPDGQQLVYVRYDEETFDAVLVLARGDGMEGRLIAEVQPVFGVFTAPRWSPDGKLLLFSASRGPVPAAPAPTEMRSLLEILLGVEVAQAHGEPATLWTVDQNGQNLTAISQPNLDDPRGAWSPDGSSIALASGTGGGVILIDVANRESKPLTDQGDFGGISWTPEVK